MSAWRGTGGHARRLDLGVDDDGDDLDYSLPPDAASSHPNARHAPKAGIPQPSLDPRSSRPNQPYHAADSTHRPPRPVGPPPLLSRPPHAPSQPPFVRPTRTPSPEPDKEVLAYLRAQQQQTSRSHSQSEIRLAEQLKRDKFQHGAGKLKSRVQREREAEERKQKQAEHDAARAYDEFVAAMGGDGSDDPRGQRSQPSVSTNKPAAFVDAGGKAYVAARTAPPAQSEASDPAQVVPRNRIANAFGDDEDDDQQDLGKGRGAQESPTQGSNAARKEAPNKRKRQAMSSFLSELQTEQAERESRLATLASETNTSISTLLAHETLRRGSRPAAGSEALTTNICIVNLPPSIDERGVADFFAAWGDVATVKIMWPRGEARERAGGLTGFVAYMTRDDAEYAFKQADGALWGGVRVKLSWGKPVSLPRRAMYPRAAPRAADEVEAAAASGSRSVVPKLILHHRRELPEPRAPEDFADTGSDELYSTDSGEESESMQQQRRPRAAAAVQPLGPRAHRRLLAMLRGLTLRRERIARITAFALDHAANYAQIVALMTNALLQPRTPVPRKLARLYALSDVLHNSGSPVSNAWRYRAAIEAQLPLVFAHLGHVARSFAGRIKREEFSAKVRALVDVWDGWIVVAPHVLDRLRSLFDRPPAMPAMSFAAACSDEHVDGEALEETGHVATDQQDEEDVDGEALDPDPGRIVGEDEQEEDLDGEAL